MFHLVGQFFFGLVIGTFAKLLMPSRDSGSVVLIALIGLLGSIIGTLIALILFGSQSFTAGWVTSFIVTVIVLIIYRYVIWTKKQHTIFH